MDGNEGIKVRKLIEQRIQEAERILQTHFDEEVKRHLLYCEGKAVEETPVTQVYKDETLGSKFFNYLLEKGPKFDGGTYITQPLIYEEEGKMTQQEYLKQFIAIADRMIQTTKSKNTDYAESNDAFANFRMIETLSNGRITTEDGIVTRITDKLKRLSSLLARPASVKSEAITDTVLDMAVYSVILLIYLEDKLNAGSGHEVLSADMAKQESRENQSLRQEVSKDKNNAVTEGIRTPSPWPTKIY